MRGYVKFFRKLRELSFMHDSCFVHALFILLSEARFMPTVINGVPVEAGQLILSVPDFCDEMGISVKTARFIITTLRDINAISYSVLNNNKLLITLKPLLLTGEGITNELLYIKGVSPDMKNESALYKELNKRVIVNVCDATENENREEAKKCGNEKAEAVSQEVNKKAEGNKAAAVGRDYKKINRLIDIVCDDMPEEQKNEAPEKKSEGICVPQNKEENAVCEKGAEELCVPQNKEENAVCEKGAEELCVPQNKEENAVCEDGEKRAAVCETGKEKKAWGKFNNVFISDNEYEELKRLVPDCNGYIERLSAYLASSGRRDYKDHYATIYSWFLRDKESGKNGDGGNAVKKICEPLKELYPEGRSYDLERAIKRSIEITPQVKHRNPETGKWEVRQKVSPQTVEL